MSAAQGTGTLETTGCLSSSPGKTVQLPFRFRRHPRCRFQALTGLVQTTGLPVVLILGLLVIYYCVCSLRSYISVLPFVPVLVAEPKYLRKAFGSFDYLMFLTSSMLRFAALAIASMGKPCSFRLFAMRFVALASPMETPSALPMKIPSFIPSALPSL